MPLSILLFVLRCLTGPAVGLQGALGQAQHTAARIHALGVDATRRHSGEEFEPIGHVLDRVNMEQALRRASTTR